VCAGTIAWAVAPEFTVLDCSNTQNCDAHADERHDPVVRRVLIVDDNNAFRAAARQLLERSGLVVVAEAATGTDAVDDAKRHRPDLALVDVQLPDFDGFDVAERLSRLDPAPKVILTSSLDGSDFGALVAGSSAVGFIPKVDLSVQAIDALLARTR
jgi:CheY-like chemotaxis protein